MAWRQVLWWASILISTGSVLIQRTLWISETNPSKAPVIQIFWCEFGDWFRSVLQKSNLYNSMDLECLLWKPSNLASNPISKLHILIYSSIIRLLLWFSLRRPRKGDNLDISQALWRGTWTTSMSIGSKALHPPPLIVSPLWKWSLLA